ncbi:MAG: diguanylate cyclase [Anaerolineales bacterium]|nr:diguanylate cyclase [Anaerolineales bacterium]
MPTGKRSIRRPQASQKRPSMLQLLPDGIILLDGAGRITEINPPARKLTGLTERKALGKSILDVFPEWEGWDEQLRRTGSKAVVRSPAQPDCTLEIIRLFAPSGRGKRAASLISIHDISDRIRMEEDHKRSLELLLDKNTSIQALSASLRDQAIRDPVTSLFNRCYIVEALKHELARAARSKAPVSVLRIRLDQYQKAGEVYGDKAVVEILKIMGSLVYRYIRRGDLASRLSGEDFLVVMPGASPSIAEPRAERLREAFHDSILNYLGSKIDCTFSCGIASYPVQGETVDGLLESAELALQESIAAGGNRVTSR